MEVTLNGTLEAQKGQRTSKHSGLALAEAAAGVAGKAGAGVARTRAGLGMGRPSAGWRDSGS